MVANANPARLSIGRGIIAGLAGAFLVFIVGCGALAVLAVIIIGAISAIFGRGRG